VTEARELAGSRVVLEARSAEGSLWAAVAGSRVDDEGHFVLRWKPKATLRLLRVSLEPTGGFAGSAAAVPEAQISACKVARHGNRWTVTCRSTARSGSVVQLLDGRRVEDRSRVRRGVFRLTGRGRTWGHRIDLTVSKGRHVRLTL
jgi:hypothetical protein